MDWFWLQLLIQMHFPEAPPLLLLGGGVTKLIQHRLDLVVYLSVGSITWQVFIEFLLCSLHCRRCWEHISDQSN